MKTDPHNLNQIIRALLHFDVTRVTPSEILIAGFTMI